MKKLFSFFAFVLVVFSAKSQIAATEIYLLDLSYNNNSPVLVNLINMSNHKGYDNQPFFSPDGKSILFTSFQDTTQSDIYEYSLATKTIKQLTHTLESEFSPTVMPDGKHFSSVVVERDSAQRLWKFGYHSFESATRIFDKEIDSVGYHCWLSANQLALFVLTEPITLQLAEVGKTKTEVIAKNIGRCFVKPKNEEGFYFVDKTDSHNYFICRYTNNKIEKLYKTLIGSEDLCMTPNGHFLMAIGSLIYSLDIVNNSWGLVTDLKSYGISTITRLAVSPDGTKLAVVGSDINQ